MNDKTPTEMLVEAGFTVHDDLGGPNGIFATIPAEPYSVSPHHFEPRERSVYVSGPMQAHLQFFYASSCIHGRWRGYRCQNWVEDVAVGNIFGSGYTQQQAVAQFIENFKAKIYNKTSHL
jgi:hypothetical protein